MIEHPENESDLRAELKRIADELDAVYADRNRTFQELQDAREKWRRFTRRLEELLREFGL